MSIGTAGYNFILVVHIFAMVAWMAGMFYLPRLFVYHADASAGSQQSETFKVMERRLYRGIMLPALIMTVLSGVALAWFGGWERDAWLLVKVLFVLALLALHGWLGAQRRAFENDANRVPSRTYRIVNEVPTLLLLAIVALVVFKPF